MDVWIAGWRRVISRNVRLSLGVNQTHWHAVLFLLFYYLLINRGGYESCRNSRIVEGLC